MAVYAFDPKTAPVRYHALEQFTERFFEHAGQLVGGGFSPSWCQVDLAAVVRAIDMPFWVNLPLEPALKAKVDAPGIIGGGAAPKGVADMSLYRRLAALGLTGLRCFPQLVSVVPGSERIERYQQQILAALTPAEVERWRQAVTAAQADGTFFIAQAYHCAVATKPG
jgi:hypothetical protein